MSTNGQVKTAETTAAADHVAAAQRELEWAASSDREDMAYHLARAQVHATLAVALADQRIADDEDRIASCVPDGGSAFGVSVSGR